MCATDSQSHIHEPVDAVLERLNDPGVAASMVTLLDHAELLSTLVLGLGAFMERGDLIVDAIAESVNDAKAAASEGSSSLPPLAEMTKLAKQGQEALPLLSMVLDSPMARPATIDLLGTMTEAAVDGAARAQQEGTKIKGARGTLKALKDPDVQHGLGVMIEIAKSIGQKYNAQNANGPSEA